MIGRRVTFMMRDEMSGCCKKRKDKVIKGGRSMISPRC